MRSASLGRADSFYLGVISGNEEMLEYNGFIGLG